jgi:hypothetical protein
MGDKFRKALINLIKQYVAGAIPGTIKDVNTDDYTCSVEPSNGTSIYYGVRLKTTINDDDSGIVCIPDIGSQVLISPLFNNENVFYVSRFSKVKKWHLKTVSNSSIEFDSSGNVNINVDSKGKLVLKTGSGGSIELDSSGNVNIKSGSSGKIVTNNGTFGGVMKITPSLKKINALEDELNKLKAIISSIIVVGTTPATTSTPVTNGTLAAFFTALLYDVTPIIPTTLIELENEKLTH